jgi:hypothetical protein
MRTGSIDGWKLTLALLVSAFLCAMAVTFYLAAHRGSRVVDRDYYSHGLHYGRTASGARNPGIGWNISASLSGPQLKVRINDASGSPVCGGTLRFNADAETSGNRGDTATEGDRHLVTKEPVPFCFALAESAPGVYTVPRPVSPQGELRGTLCFTRGEAVATQRLVLFQ